MKIDKATLVWSLAAVVLTSMMLLCTPGELVESPVKTRLVSSAEQWLHGERYGIHHPETFVRTLFISNKRLADYRVDKALSAETISRMNFMAEETGLTEEAAWLLLQGCEALHLDPWLVLAVIDVETGGTFRNDLVGGNEDRGYMQITPITERHLFNRYSHQWPFGYDPAMIFKSWYNLTLGMQYLRELADRQDETDWAQVLSEYNRGPEGLRIYFDRHQTVETDYSRRVLDKRRYWVNRYEGDGS